MNHPWSREARNDRLDPRKGHKTMKAVVTSGHGSYEALECREVAVPSLEKGEVLLQVLAAGVNNTEINTRLGWYSSTITTGTEDAAETGGHPELEPTAGGWNETTPFPLIQGTDCCGRVVEVAPGVDERLMGKRVLVRACMRRDGFESMDTIWMGSDFDGAFAQFVKVPAGEVFSVECDWSDSELAAIPCAYGTAENMCHRSNVKKGEHVLVPGASGGVGTATVQLAKRRGANVTAIAGSKKRDQVLALGADRVIDRGDDLVAALGRHSVDVAIDTVAGPAIEGLLNVLKRGGRYAASGAIAGPLVTIDMRTFYLNDLTLIGCTAWDEPVFGNLIRCIERGELRPLVAGEFPMAQIADAQREFLEKKHVGKFVLIPPPLTAVL